ncbi:MAG: RNA polymerase sigma factor [Isosphaeraceae bacterium]
MLVRKAGSLRQRERLGNWLYGVATKVAARSRSTSARRLAREAGALPVDEIAGNGSTAAAPLLDPGYDEELTRLPEKYRAPVVLCYLEGLTHEEAADRLGWPVGTVKGRLARAKELLKTRLTRRGLTFATAAAVLDRFASETPAALPERLAIPTVQAASRLAAGQAAAGPLSASSLALSEGVVQAMSLSRIKSVSAASLVAGLLVTTGGALAYQEASARPKAEAASAVSPPAGKSSSASASSSVAPAPTRGETASASAGDTFTPQPGVTNGNGPKDPGAEGGRSPVPGKKAVVQPQGGGREAPMMMGGMGPGVSPGGGMMGGGMLAPATDDDALRTLIAAIAPRVAAADKSPQTKAALDRLEKPLAMKFPNETPLEDVLKYIKASSEVAGGTPLQIYVDPVGLQAAEQTLTSPVTLDLDHVPLRTSLRLALKQLGLAYCVSDGLLIISSPLGIYQELQEAMSVLEPGSVRGMPKLPGMSGGGGMM